MPAPSKITQAIRILSELGMPIGQINERTALCLLALLDLKKKTAWSGATNPLVGITPIMDFARFNYGKRYAPNSRETFRRQSMHQLVSAGVVQYNPDKPDRPVNSPKAVYQMAPEALEILRLFGTPEWDSSLAAFIVAKPSLRTRYAMPRDMAMISVTMPTGKKLRLSPGDHSLLIKVIVEQFAPRFAPNSQLVYAGDTGKKWGHFDAGLLASLGVTMDGHGKMPDVVLHYSARGWILLIEAVTSHGPVDGKRHNELEELFAAQRSKLVFVTAFPSRAVMSRYLAAIAWETEVWCADSPEHLIHFNGKRFLGPHGEGD